MKKFPIRKKYELKINIKRKILFFNKSKVILLKYKEASIIEIIDFLKSEKQIIEYFSDFILSNSNATEKDLWEILKNFDIIWKQLNNTFLKWLDNTKKEKIWWTSIKQDNWWFNAYIVLLSEKLNIDPMKILTKYTLNQLNYFTEWIIYNINEQTEQWKAKNRMNNIKKQREDLNDKDAQKIKDFIYSD